MTIEVEHSSRSLKLQPEMIKILVALLEQLLTTEGLAAGEVNLVFGDDNMLHKLNLEYRAKDRATDVLSFSYIEGESGLETAETFPLGDIFISLDRAEEQAFAAGHSLEREVALLALHGLLHLLGFDHENDRDYSVMQARERELLGQYDRLSSGGEVDR